MKKKIASENLTKALLQLNLTEKEIMSYLILLQRGALSVQDISRSTGINRVTTYAAIEELKQKGLISESRKGKRKLFVAEDPESIQNLIIEKREKIRKEEKIFENIILPALKAIDINQENRPEVKFFEGADRINKVYDDYVLKASEVINCGSYDTAVRVLTEKYEMDYFHEIKKRRMFYRMILEDTPMNRKFAQLGRGIVHAKFLPIETRISADFVVFGGKYTSLISYDRQTATLIEDESIFQAIKMFMDFMWDRL